eukprot:5897184-Pleurochrysis_carterae.AAC.1
MAIPVPHDIFDTHYRYEARGPRSEFDEGKLLSTYLGGNVFACTVLRARTMATAAGSNATGFLRLRERPRRA